VAHAYTPGLKVVDQMVVRKERRLPLKGEVVTQVGEKVKAETVVARTSLPGNVQTVNVAGLLGVLAEDVPEFMVKQVGEPFVKGDPIAQSKGFFGLMKSFVRAPCDGAIESISDVTGQVIIREPPEPVEVDAYVDGEVVEVIEAEGAVVETVASFIQGIFGVGGEVVGEIKRVSDSPADVLTPSEIDESARGKILIGGSLVTADAVRRAAEVGARGVVVGGISDGDLRQFLGYDIGVAITGSEDIGVTLVITEGFGKMTMAARTFELLTSHAGKRASVNGATQIRAGVIRPEVVVPLIEISGGREAASLSSGLEIGSRIRIIREPHFGKLAKVVALPAELEGIETEAKVRILEVELDDGTRARLPRANVEMIEE
jgi:hypothetical protein